eukprot:CAMPEP_0113721684 /NCGR_PEP_ID=MMETSP0038_2-20120614/37283_1 /TAXON_ID=2898 /ORGANISM="Cryptomonas paramecium" /LENGTH=286 /DNA_ID=CAMNT_0000650747 /DNA_START=1 /DNA_END=858 /DNA_ORIENTATION=+ /assembly_acc=CAM_ASM_000170
MYYAAYKLIRIVRVATADADLEVLAALRNMPKAAFKDKVCWITGASSGIGEALALELSNQGAKLILSARREGELARVADSCRRYACAKEVEVLQLDISDYASHKAAVTRVVSRFGRIDYLINNAGRLQRGLVEETELAVDKAIFETNVLGTISLTKAALPQLLSQPGGGVIVNTNSITGKVGLACSAAYSASKHALQGFFDSLRMELAGRGVRVLNLCPGPTETQMHRCAFSTTLAPPPQVQDDHPKLSPERCAALMAAAMHAELPEAWMANPPFLLVVGTVLRHP